MTWAKNLLFFLYSKSEKKIQLTRLKITNNKCVCNIWVCLCRLNLNLFYFLCVDIISFLSDVSVGKKKCMKCLPMVKPELKKPRMKSCRFFSLNTLDE